MIALEDRDAIVREPGAREDAAVAFGGRERRVGAEREEDVAFEIERPARKRMTAQPVVQVEQSDPVDQLAAFAEPGLDLRIVGPGIEGQYVDVDPAEPHERSRTMQKRARHAAVVIRNAPGHGEVPAWRHPSEESRDDARSLIPAATCVP